MSNSHYSSNRSLNQLLYDIREAIANARKGLRRRIMLFPIKTYYQILINQDHTFLVDEKWDNLIVLDACRYDLFEKFNDIPGKLKKIISAGSSTIPWLINNFKELFLKDTIYISANPFVSNYYLHKRLNYNPFYKIYEVWKDGWDNELNTVHPSNVNKVALKSSVLHNIKKHIIHYMQPHHPFIGEFKIIGSHAVPLREEILSLKKNKTLNPWNEMIKGNLSAEIIWKAYISNFKLVINNVKKLLPFLEGKTCITSDHGNSFGRFGIIYGHHNDINIPELVEVPYLEVA